MASKTILVDDYDGSELPDDTTPFNLTVGRTGYDLYLSEESYGKLLEVLTPFIEGADKSKSTSRVTGAVRSAPASVDADKWSAAEKKAARYWAIDNDFEYPHPTQRDKDGKPVMKKVGDRGRVANEAMEAWEKAGSPEIGS